MENYEKALYFGLSKKKILLAYILWPICTSVKPPDRFQIVFIINSNAYNSNKHLVLKNKFARKPERIEQRRKWEEKNTFKKTSSTTRQRNRNGVNGLRERYRDCACVLLYHFRYIVDVMNFSDLQNETKSFNLHPILEQLYAVHITFSFWSNLFYFGKFFCYFHLVHIRLASNTFLPNNCQHHNRHTKDRMIHEIMWKIMKRWKTVCKPYANWWDETNEKQKKNWSVFENVYNSKVGLIIHLSIF